MSEPSTPMERISARVERRVAAHLRGPFKETSDGWCNSCDVPWPCPEVKDLLDLLTLAEALQTIAEHGYAILNTSALQSQVIAAEHRIMARDALRKVAGGEGK